MIPNTIIKRKGNPNKERKEKTKIKNRQKAA